MCVRLEQRPISFDGWPTWIGILWKWPSMLTELAGDGECR